MYAVIHKDSGQEISYHDTVQECLRMISVYENADGVTGELIPDSYGWKPVEDLTTQTQ